MKKPTYQRKKVPKADNTRAGTSIKFQNQNQRAILLALNGPAQLGRSGPNRQLREIENTLYSASCEQYKRITHVVPWWAGPGGSARSLFGSLGRFVPLFLSLFNSGLWKINYPFDPYYL